MELFCRGRPVRHAWRGRRLLIAATHTLCPYSNRSGQIDVNELQQCLSNGSWAPFNIDTVRCACCARAVGWALMEAY